jgi:hypothetical protein
MHETKISNIKRINRQQGNISINYKQINKMRNTQKAAILLVFLAGAFATNAPIKTRLG